MITIVIPTLWRAARLADLVDNIHDTTRTSHQVMFVAERHDTETVIKVRRLAALDKRVKPVWNTRSANCCGAFNSGHAAVRSPYWFAGADDIYFHDGWDVPCLTQMVDPIKVVGTNDLYSGAVTHFLVATDYSRDHGLTFDEEPGLVAHEGYGHDFFDTEAIVVARRREVFAPCTDSIVEHKHYVWGQAEVDRTYERNLQLGTSDPSFYQSRLDVWNRRCAA